MRFIVKTDSAELEKNLKNAPRSVKKILADGLDHSTRSFMKTLYKERMQGEPGIKARPRGIFHRFRRVVIVKNKALFLTQSAPASRTVSAIVNSDKDPLNMSIEIFTHSKVAGIHERGGQIAATGAMPIPLSDAARTILREKSVDFKSLFPLVINGKVFLARKVTKDAAPELLFILKRGIRIRPRLGFYQTWAKHAPRREQIMDEAMQKAYEKMA